MPYRFNKSKKAKQKLFFAKRKIKAKFRREGQEKDLKLKVDNTLKV